MYMYVCKGGITYCLHMKFMTSIHICKHQRYSTDAGLSAKNYHLTDLTALLTARHVLLGVEMLLKDSHLREDVGLPQGEKESDEEDETGEAANDVVPTLGERHAQCYIDGVELCSVGEVFLAALYLHEAPECELPGLVLICCLRSRRI